MPARVLTIAGSDPSGGAGIQADLRAFSALGVVGLSAVTAITVQNSQGVRSVHPIPGDVLYSQAAALFEDGPMDAVKIGMLAGDAQVQAVADLLKRFNPVNVVLDPVLASTGGVPLLDEAGRKLLLSDLLPLCDLVSPNLFELAALSRIADTDPKFQSLGARALIECGAQAVLVKGGHLPGRPIDTLFRPSDFAGAAVPDRGAPFTGERVETAHTHGTGCLLSSAIAAYMASGFPLTRAISNAKSLLTQALGCPAMSGAGRGYPDVLEAVRLQRLRPGSEPSTEITIQEAIHGQLYVITDSVIRPDRPVEEIVRAALDGGAKLVQLREKNATTSDLINMATKVGEMCHGAGAKLIVNDRVDVALATLAHGVHLGPGDMHPRDARRLLGPDMLIGVSAGTVAEAVELAPFSSYIGVGAIFGSKTKLDAGLPVGLDRIREIKAAIADRPIPIVAIGSITLENIRDVALAGADCAAVVSAVIDAPDMKLATERLIAEFRSEMDGLVSGSRF